MHACRIKFVTSQIYSQILEICHPPLLQAESLGNILFAEFQDMTH